MGRKQYDVKPKLEGASNMVLFLLGLAVTLRSAGLESYVEPPPALDVLAADPWLRAKWTTAAGTNSDHLHAISILVSNVDCPHIQSYILNTLLPTGASLHEVLRQLSLQYLPAQATLLAEITSLSWAPDDSVQTFFRRAMSLLTQYRQLLSLTKEAGAPDPVGFDDKSYLQLILNAMPLPFAQAVASLVIAVRL